MIRIKHVMTFHQTHDYDNDTLNCMKDACGMSVDHSFTEAVVSPASKLLHEIELDAGLQQPHYELHEGRHCAVRPVGSLHGLWDVFQ